MTNVGSSHVTGPGICGPGGLHILGLGLGLVLGIGLGLVCFSSFRARGGFRFWLGPGTRLYPKCVCVCMCVICLFSSDVEILSKATNTKYPSKDCTTCLNMIL